MSSALFSSEPQDRTIAPGARLLGGFAEPFETELLRAVDDVSAQAPFRRMVTPGGYSMSVEMTNCGSLGWVTDRRGYRYQSEDPETGRPWPLMPEVFSDLASQAAERAGFERFLPDAGLLNRYAPGTRLSLHQDRNERDFDAPIVSVSLGLPAVFLFGGMRRNDRPLRIPLHHGDVVVWGGPARLRFHGVLPIGEGTHPLTGSSRINLTLRKAS
jgi:alkylated DNA repair protein (DNA oxidative demethylase)